MYKIEEKAPKFDKDEEYLEELGDLLDDFD